jgi:CO/xanthine dehydrogenase Mo-binding subunit
VDGRSYSPATRKEYGLATTHTDTMNQAAADKTADTANAASGAAAKGAGGPQPTAATESTLAALKSKILGIFKRPS